MKKKCYSLDQTSECRYINNNLHLYSDSEILVNKQNWGQFVYSEYLAVLQIANL